MKIKTAGLLIVFWIFICSSELSIAQVFPGSTGDTKICGSDTIDYDDWVPEVFYIGLKRKRVSFAPACEKHDICFRTPGASKDACDTNFYNDLLAQCSRSMGGNTLVNTYYTRCSLLVLPYVKAVRNLGFESHREGMKSGQKVIDVLLQRYRPIFTQHSLGTIQAAVGQACYNNFDKNDKGKCKIEVAAKVVAKRFGVAATPVQQPTTEAVTRAAVLSAGCRKGDAFGNPQCTKTETQCVTASPGFTVDTKTVFARTRGHSPSGHGSASCEPANSNSKRACLTLHRSSSGDLTQLKAMHTVSCELHFVEQRTLKTPERAKDHVFIP